MKAKRKRKDPEIVIRGGTPTAVILCTPYRELLEWVEDAEDLKTLRAMRRRPLKFYKTYLDIALCARKIDTLIRRLHRCPRGPAGFCRQRLGLPLRGADKHVTSFRPNSNNRGQRAGILTICANISLNPCDDTGLL
jgi:hypothetical protein